MTETPGDALLRSLSREHERVVLVRDDASGLQAAIAIHSTVLGPALGGLRVRRYAHGLPEALDDALRLSRAMTLKAAAAGLDLGGGKAVLADDGNAARRGARLRTFAREVERLDGAYVTAEDLGTTTADMELIAEHTHHVVGRARRGRLGGDPSPSTARTVLDAMAAALDGEARDGGAAAPALAGRTVGVIGLGKVGGALAALLVEAGARVVGADPSADARERARALGVELAPSARDVLARELDVLAPCAVGGLVDETAAEQARWRVVCGAANNALGGERTAELLARRGILCVPDFLANCGGLIHADCERRGATDPADLERALAAAGARTRDVLQEARASGRTPGAIAEERALARIEAARECGGGSAAGAGRRAAAAVR